MVIELSNEFLTVQFKERGGELASIKDRDGVEYLWQGDPEYWSGQAPVLFPNCGSVRNDKAMYIMEDGEVLEGILPRHGFSLRKSMNGESCLRLKIMKRCWSSIRIHFD